MKERELFVLLGETTTGPLGEQGLRTLIAKGDVDGDSLVWHAELSEWTPLGQITGLASLLPSPATGSLFDPVDAAASPFAATGTGARDESSVLFSLANLRGLAGVERAAPAVGQAKPKASVTEGSGLIDIRALATSVGDGAKPASAPSVDLVLSLGGPSLLGAPLLAPIAPPPSRAPRVLTFALAALAGVLVLGLAAVGVASRSRGDAERSAADRPVASAEEARSEDPVALPPASVDVASLSEPPAPSAPPSSESAASTDAPPRPDPARPRAPRAAPAVPHVSVDPSPPVVPAVAPAPRGIDELMRRVAEADASASEHDRVALPETPARDSVRRAMEALTPAVRACAGGAHGRALVSVVVSGATGRARSASVGGDFASGEATACMERALRGIELAPFARSTFTVAYPFSL